MEHLAHVVQKGHVVQPGLVELQVQQVFVALQDQQAHVGH